MESRRQHRSLTRRALIPAAVVILILALWFSGLLGRFLFFNLLPLLLPREIGDDATVEHISTGTPAGDTGVFLLLTPDRARRMCEDALPLFRFMPAGIIPSGASVAGHLRLPASGNDRRDALPFTLRFRDDAPYHPHLFVNYPVDGLNRLLRSSLEDGLRDREEYLLGHYTLTYEVRLDSFTLASDRNFPAAPVRQRTFNFEAAGRVRVHLEENLFEIRTTGDVRHLDGYLTATLDPGPASLAVRYEVEITRLEADFNNINAVIDRHLSETLERALERSLNRRRKKERNTFTLPSWFPRDLVIEAQAGSS